MTFSDSRIVKLLKNDYVPVWESVAPVREVTFDLGEGRSVKGTVGGEIALYFCTPQGMVFDILPALQSPAATRQAIENALAFYRKHHGKPGVKAIADWHRARMRKTLEIVWKDHPDKFRKAYPHIEKLQARQIYPQAKRGEDKREAYIRSALDDATRDMRVMAMSKVAVMPSRKNQVMTVVEPGGRGYFLWQIDRCFLGMLPLAESNRSKGKRSGDDAVRKTDISDLLDGGRGAFIKRITDKNERVRVRQWNSLPKPPSAWKHLLFEGILYQPLKGGKVTYDSESLEAISIQEE